MQINTCKYTDYFVYLGMIACFSLCIYINIPYFFDEVWELIYYHFMWSMP